jgi:hypothetical protein
MSHRFDHPAIIELLLTQWCEPDDGSPTWATYGITEKVKRAIIAAQAGECSICHEKRPLVVDHDHTTQRVRGLICGRCNTKLGNNRDDTEQMRAISARYARAAHYIDHAVEVRPYAKGTYAEWLERKSARAPAPVEDIDVRDILRRNGLRTIMSGPRAGSLADVWPPGRLHGLPHKHVVFEANADLPCNRNIARVTVGWVANDVVEYYSRRPGYLEYACKSGVRDTARAALASCREPTRALALYARSFMHMYEHAFHKDVALDLFDWLRPMVSAELKDNFWPWHHKVRITLPEEDYLSAAELRAIASGQDLLDAILLHWSHVTATNTILEVHAAA